MDILNHLAQAAAVLLLIELLVVLIIFLAVAGGLAFGLRWVNGKSDWAFNKVNGYLPIGRKYIHKGLDLAAAPVIKLSAFAETVKGTMRVLEQLVRSRLQSAPTEVTARPAARPLDDETTRIEPLPLT